MCSLPRPMGRMSPCIAFIPLEAELGSERCQWRNKHPRVCSSDTRPLCMQTGGLKAAQVCGFDLKRSETLPWDMLITCKWKAPDKKDTRVLLDYWHQRKHIFIQDPATLVFILCIINESKPHLNCSLADLLTVSHLHCVACAGAVRDHDRYTSCYPIKDYVLLYSLVLLS